MAQEEPKFKKIVNAADGLSLGISIVVAVLIGVWIGVFIGIGAAISNVYKAYAKQKKSLDELAKDPRYTYKKEQQDKYDAEDDDE